MSSSPARTEFFVNTLRRRIATLMISVLVVLLVAGGLSAYGEYRQTWDSARQNLLGSASACQQSLTALLEQSAYSIDGIAADLDAAGGDDARVAQLVRTAMRFDPLSAYLGVRNARDGSLVVIAQDGSNAPVVLITAIRAALPGKRGRGLEIRRVIELPGADTAFMPMVLGASAQAGGDRIVTIFALVPVARLAAAAANYGTLPGTSLGLLNGDGDRLFRFSEAGTIEAINGPAPPPEAMLELAAPSGVFRAISPVTGADTLFGFSHSNALPFIAGIALPVDQLRSQWLHAMVAPSVLLIIGMLTVAVFGARLRAAYNELNTSVKQQMLTARRLLDVQESERRVLARELHDSVGQQLTALSLNLSLISSSVPAEMSGSIGAHLSDSQDLLEATTVHVRDVMVELRPPGIDEFGLLAALKDHVQRVERRSGLNIAVHGSEPAPRLPAQTLIALFRVAQEAINNVVKHARARTIEVELNQVGDRISMSIQDDGSGFDPQALRASGRGGMGTTTMRERAEAIGAQLTINSHSARGTRVEISFSWPQAEAAP